MKEKKRTYSKIELSKLSTEALIKIIEEQKQENEQLKSEFSDLKESQGKYKSLFELSDDAILVLEDSKFIDCNDAVIKMFGFEDRNQVLNIHPSEISPEKQPDGKNSLKKAERMIALALKKGSHHFEWMHTRANGEDFPAEVWLSRIDLDDRVMVNAILRDLTEIKRAERIIFKNLEEKEILIKEIHHRVKNNLQLIISLLNLQSEYVKSKTAEKALVESKNRIASISKVHEMLYMAENLTKIRYDEYLDFLLETLLDNLSDRRKKINFVTDVNKLRVNINTAVPLGLLINEMVTNSLKYAFPNQSEGEIKITIHSIEKKKYQFFYSDNGVGYDKDIDFNNVETLGFQLIYSLVEQLNGSVERIHKSKGTHYKVIFEII